MQTLTKRPLSNYQDTPNAFGGELQDHINISQESKTQIGKLLDPEYIFPFTYPHIGRFTSVFGLWQWLQNSTHSDSFRVLSPLEIKRILHVTPDIKTNFVKNFRAIIAYSTWLKVKKSRQAMFELKEIPRDLKYIFYKTIKTSSTDARLALKYPFWLSDIAEEIHSAVVNETIPDFSKFATNKKEVRFMFLEGFLKERLPVIYENLMKEKDVTH
jgi:hypothetical protein